VTIVRVCRFEAGVHRAPPDDVREAEAVYLTNGWRVFVVPDGIDSEERFFDAVVATFPLDPPLQRDVWDALDDSLWGGLDTLPETQVAILWPDALTLADAHPAAHEVALSTLTGLTRSLRNAEHLGGGFTYDRRRGHRQLVVGGHSGTLAQVSFLHLDMPIHRQK
jgi:barstar (barnase inhibitor)